MRSDTQLLPHLSAKQVRENGKQYYVDAEGAKLPSVTTILNATKPQEDRDRLFNWQQRVGVAEAKQISGAASRRGTGTHKQIQRYLEGKDSPCPDAIQPYWQSIEPILQDISHVRLIEGTVFNYDLGYAGRVDCVASFRNIPCICEWKTADKPKGSVERLYDYPLQIAAYCSAVNHYYQDYDINLEHTMLAVAIPGLPAEVFWFEPEVMQTLLQQWEERVAAFWKRRS
ncbi:MAG: exonuclease [Symplocastrum torsivum CPER-KK1]|jgi:genome maintenance exonuclease 1|uniref:Exonuclease n=1 Tax=Symplocastrum torsivum CPER-KK1 TaxID=450513 RepID=A0A951U872_9CYAN|nr:exonuclease [Symplocastrum torsivum CPER-KK1]